MKKAVSLILGVMVAFCVCACGKGVQAHKKLIVVTTIFPLYDWTRQIAGDNGNIEITMLLDSGADLHSFQPTADDIVKIATCDMFVYVGGESDKWVIDALKESTNKDLIAVNLFDKLGDNKREEELKEGMQGEAEEEEGEEEIEYDEHIWLSLKNAKILCNAICEGLCLADKSNSNVYKTNNNDYTDELDKLDKEYEAAVNAGNKKTLVFGDRFPFRYMTDDYDIDYYAAFIGCSAESEASFKTVMFLANKVDELGLDSIIKIEGSDGKIADTVKENTKAKKLKILTLDSMQSVTSKQVNEGVTYLDICKKNLEVLKEALS